MTIGGKELPQVDVTSKVTTTLVITAIVMAIWLWTMVRGCLPC